MTGIYIATEDSLSTAVIEKLVDETRGRLQIDVRISGHGSGGLRRRLPELTRVAYSIPVILLTDLDRKACAPSLIDEWFGQRVIPPAFLFRVAIREVEAWLLADAERFAAFAGIPRRRLSDTPEEMDDPKQTLLNLIWRHSPADIKQDIVRRSAGGPHQGLGYNLRLIRFVREAWRPGEAAGRCESLARARRRILALAG